MSYTESLENPTGTGLTLATSSLSPTAAHSHHSAPFFGGKGKLLETPQGTLDLLSLCLENRGEKTSGCFSCSFPSPKEREADECLCPSLLQHKVEVGSTTCASGLLVSTIHSPYRSFSSLSLRRVLGARGAQLQLPLHSGPGSSAS